MQSNYFNIGLHGLEQITHGDEIITTASLHYYISLHLNPQNWSKYACLMQSTVNFEASGFIIYEMIENLTVK